VIASHLSSFAGRGRGAHPRPAELAVRMGERMRHPIQHSGKVINPMKTNMSKPLMSNSNQKPNTDRRPTPTLPA